MAPNIRVDAVLPGEEMNKDYLDRISMRRMTPPEDVAAMVLFLLCVEWRNILGESLGVDGNVESL